MMRYLNAVLVVLSVCASSAVAATAPIRPDKPNVLQFPPAEARFVRLVVAAAQSEPCIDELEVFAEGPENLALASSGAKATASSCLPGYDIHKIAHLNDGLYGNSHSWIAAGRGKEWAQIELPKPARVAKVVFSRDREGKFRDRVPGYVEVRLSLDGATWRTVARIGDAGEALLPSGPLSYDDVVRYAFACEERSLRKMGVADTAAHALRQMEEMVERLAAMNKDVTRERAELSELRKLLAAPASRPALSPEGRGWGEGVDEEAARARLFAVRSAKRRLFLREPALAELDKILFVKRQPFMPSHNYSDLLDSRGAPGGAICILQIPHRDGRLEPAEARLIPIFETRDGVARDPMANFDASRIYFAHRATKDGYYRLMSVRPDGSELATLTDGPFHDFYPCPLPDGGLAFMSTRCRARFLCWRPQSFVLFRMDEGGRNIRPLSYANLSEWAPAVLSDGRIIWTRSEYLDKGADFGHTLWAIRPDGSHPELLFGNNTRFCYVNGREVPGTGELCCTLISHGGDLNGPLALLDLPNKQKGAAAVKNITPDVPPRFHMDWAQRECFRDPVPLSRDLVLCSHAPEDRFGLYLIDRYGNREILYFDPAIGSMCPSPLRPVPTPPVLGSSENTAGELGQFGQFFVSDVYQGLEPAVKRGAVKYIRVCQEVRAELLQQANGEYQKDHPEFEDWYATPTHKVRGPHGWPSYVAKASLGLARVEADGSANFYAPAGKVLYFEALDENYNELQRMRSVVQLQPGEKRGCIGCHENRESAAPLTLPSPQGGEGGVRGRAALRREPCKLEEPAWGPGPFAYEKVVQPVWDAKCVRCHDGSDKKKFNLSGALDRDKVPLSYRTLIEQGWVHYFDYTWGCEHSKAEPLSFGTLKSRLFILLSAPHYDVKLSAAEQQRIKCWIDLNCPLWPDYVYRPAR